MNIHTPPKTNGKGGGRGDGRRKPNRTPKGRQVDPSALDDVQAGNNSFTVELTRAKTLLQQLLAKNDGEDGGQIENLGWKVETTKRRGLAVVWIPLSDVLMRGGIEDIIKGSDCKAKVLG